MSEQKDSILLDLTATLALLGGSGLELENKTYFVEIRPLQMVNGDAVQEVIVNGKSHGFVNVRKHIAEITRRLDELKKLTLEKIG